MELTKRSNFAIDVTNIATTPVVIKKGLNAIDFIGVIVKENAVSFAMIVNVAYLNGIVKFAIGPEAFFDYDPATGQITVANF